MIPTREEKMARIAALAAIVQVHHSWPTGLSPVQAPFTGDPYSEVCHLAPWLLINKPKIKKIEYWTMMYESSFRNEAYIDQQAVTWPWIKEVMDHVIGS